MKYTICIELPGSYYTINGVDEQDAETIASAFEQKLDNFFYSGTNYDIKDIKQFKVFAYENEEDYGNKINGSQEILKEGIFTPDGFVYFKPYSLSKLFQDVTNQFIRKFAFDRKETGKYPYINKTRIDDLITIKHNNFDLRRLIKLCEEINETFDSRCFIATILLVRALLDHIPPIFGKKNFSEVANNYGSKSFKDTMISLDTLL